VKPARYIGIMSGTSLDGVDAVLADLASGVVVLAHAHRPFDPALRAELLALNGSGADELHRAALTGNALARLYADAAFSVLQAAALSPKDVLAIGAHGQTVRHRPGEFDASGYTIQLLNAALLAELSGIAVVADLRSRDVAAGGQGAPLVPGFHRAVFGRPETSTAVLNLGGIANLTLLPTDGSTLGFDCGPANALLDHWCERHCGAAFDDSGSWAAGGQVIDALLSTLLSDPYFARLPPKSTGRDRFNAQWLSRHLQAWPEADARDVQATLAELSARTAADALRRYAPGTVELLVCGGGALNAHLMARLSALLPGCTVFSTDARGLPATQVEAAAFAWLAQAHCERRPGNLPAVTGAAGPRILGAMYPA
jgi:anhydro-N-acetylmuramic acid kinase